MSITLYVIGWILILLIVVAVTIVLIYSRKISKCVNNRILFCYASENNGWKCNSRNGTQTTLRNKLDEVAKRCDPVECTSLGSERYTIYPVNDNFLIPSTNITLRPLTNFASDPLRIVGTEVTKKDFLAWACNPNKIMSVGKREIIRNFIVSNQEAIHSCNPITFSSL